MATIAVGFGLGVGPLAGTWPVAIGAGVLDGVFLANPVGPGDKRQETGRGTAHTAAWGSMPTPRPSS
jgi:hypothetical protein